MHFFFPGFWIGGRADVNSLGGGEESKHLLDNFYQHKNLHENEVTCTILITTSGDSWGIQMFLNTYDYSTLGYWSSLL